MICRYGMLFQLYPLPNLNPHHPQFISKSYGTSCLYAHTQSTEAQLTLCAKALLFQIICCMHIQITILDGHTGINLGVWYPWVAAHVF